MGVSCGPARFCLVGGEASFVCLAEERGAWSYSSPVVSPASRRFVSYSVSLLVPHVLRAGAAGRACPSHLIVLLASSGGAFIPVSSWRLVARLGERGGFGFSFYPDGERRGCGSRPAVPGPVLACLDAVGEWGDVVLVIGVPACFLSSYGCGALGLCGVPPPFGSSSSASCSPGYRSRLGPLIRFDGLNGRRDGGLLGYRGVAHHVSSIGVYNEYDVCDV